MAKKTKEELEEVLSTAIADAKAKYDSIVKPAQEKFKAVERQARILEQIINKRSSEPKDYKEQYLIQPIQSELIQWDTPNRKQELSSNNTLCFRKLLDMPREVSPETYEFLEPYIIETAIQNNINAAEDTYRKVVAMAMSETMEIAKLAKISKDAAITLAYKQYDKALKELRKVDDWFEYRRTYQRSLRSGTHEEIKAKAASECGVDVACTGPQSTVTRLKCHFCGGSEARTEAGLNRVKYRLKHPGAGFWSTLLGRNWKYACQDCADYMAHLWGHVEMKPVEENRSKG